MFGFFKRPSPAPAKAAAKAPANPAPRQARSSTRGPLLVEPPPVPQVVEGNEQTDWALWEDSVMLLDSQMQGLTPSARIYGREKEAPSEYQDVDPFARIGRKSA